MLPYEGGLLDQPNLAMVKMEAILLIFRELEENEAKKSEAMNRLRKQVHG